MKKLDFSGVHPPEFFILDVIYHVKTVEEALRSREDIERFGAPTTGFAQYDRDMIGMYTYPYLNIDRMSKIHEAGYYIGLMRPTDAHSVYLSVQHYLECWMRVLNNSINAVKAPFEILYRLERLAQVIYPSAASKFITNVSQDDPFACFIEAFESQMELPSLTVKKPVEKDESDKPMRYSLQDELLEHQARGMR